MDQTTAFEAERPRLRRIAARVLDDPVEAEDVVQVAWLRLDHTDTVIDDLPAWLTTVTTRLCLDRLKARTPVPVAEIDVAESAPDPADDVALADTVGLALQVVLDRLSPRERVAFVLHDTFGFAFDSIATILRTSPAAARKLASRARAKVTDRPEHAGRLDDREVADAFMAAARSGDFERLLVLLAPDVVVGADDAAVLAGTPRHIEGRHDVASFFHGSAHAALPVTFADRPGYAWFHRGEAKVLLDFTVVGGTVQAITFRAEPHDLTHIRRRSTR